MLGMGVYHIIPYEYLIGRLVFYICLYGSIAGFLLYLRSNSIEIKYKRFYLTASIFSIVKMVYHLWVAITKYKHYTALNSYKESIISYEKALIEYDDLLIKYNEAISDYSFKVIGIESELFAAIFTGIVFIILIALKINNK